MKIKFLPAFLFISFLFLAFLGWNYFEYRQKLGRASPEEFYRLTAADPLFYGPKLDAEKLQKSLAVLAEKEASFKKTLLEKYLYESKYGNPEQTLSEDRRVYYKRLLTQSDQTFLFPLKFLNLLPEISKTTKIFLGSRSNEAAARLLKLYEEAALAYKNSALEQRAALEFLMAADPAVTGEKFTGLASASNPNIALSDFRLLEKNAFSLQKEVETRKKCFWEGICPPPPLEDRTSRAEIENLSSKGGGFKSPVPDDLLFADAGPNFKNLGLFRVKTACYGNEENNLKPERLLYLLITADEQFMPKSAADNFYFDLNQDVTVFGEKLRQEEVKYDSNPDGTDYLCNDLTYWAELSLAAAGDKLTYLPEMLNAITDHLWVFETVIKYGSLPPGSSFLVGRSSYSISYLPFAESVWRIGQRPQHIEPEARRPQHWRSYSELKKELDDETIKTFHFSSQKIRKEIVREREEEGRQELGLLRYSFRKYRIAFELKILSTIGFLLPI